MILTLNTIESFKILGERLTQTKSARPLSAPRVDTSLTLHEPISHLSNEFQDRLNFMEKKLDEYWRYQGQ